MFLRRGFSAHLGSNNCANYLQHYNTLRILLAKPIIFPRAGRLHLTKWFTSSSPPAASNNLSQDYSKRSYEDLVKESSTKDQEIQRIQAELEKDRMKMSEVVEKRIYDRLAGEVSKKKQEVEQARAALEKEKKRGQNLQEEAKKITSSSWSYDLDEKMRAEYSEKIVKLDKELEFSEACGISWIVRSVTNNFTNSLRSKGYLDSSEDDNAMRSAYRSFLDDSSNVEAKWIIQELKSNDMTVEEFINKCMTAREKSYRTVSGLVTTFRLVRSFDDYLSCLSFDPPPFEEKEKISIDLLARCSYESKYYYLNSDSDTNSISDSSVISDSNSSSDSVEVE